MYSGHSAGHDARKRKFIVSFIRVSRKKKIIRLDPVEIRERRARVFRRRVVPDRTRASAAGVIVPDGRFRLEVIRTRGNSAFLPRAHEGRGRSPHEPVSVNITTRRNNNTPHDNMYLFYTITIIV